jgi:hypothetical protein
VRRVVKVARERDGAADMEEIPIRLHLRLPVYNIESDGESDSSGVHQCVYRG